MKRKAKRCWYGLVVCALLAAQAQAQSDNGGTARVSDQPAGSPAATMPLPEPDSSFDPRFSGPPTGLYEASPVDVIFNPRITVDNRSNQLYGYDSGFSTINAFLPYFIEENALLFASGGGLVTYNGRGGANVGVGWRYYMQDIDRVVGLSAWYDFDAGNARSYNQIGLSFESLGRYFDLRLNGYVPIGQDQNVLSTTLAGPIQFVQNQLRLQSLADTETAMTGFDSEIGGPMPLLGRYGLSGYAGFYYFTSHSNHTDLTGVSGRLAWQVNEDTTVGFQVTDDHVFGTNTQIQVALSLPDGGSSGWLRQPRVRDRMMQNVFRRSRITVNREVISTEVAAINPKDDQPYFVVHVDPNGATDVPEGDGTVENPYNLISQFNNLAAAPKSAVDIIYVTARDDGTSTNLDTGVQLLDCQRLLSTAVQHTFVSQGQIFDLPGFDAMATRPILTNITPALPGSPVVTLANMNEVSGFQIDGTHPETINTRTYNIGIASQAGGITNFDINNNTILNTLEGIDIVSTGAAEGFIDDNEITGIGNRSISGITVVHVDNALDLRISNNVVTNVLGEDVNNNQTLDPTEDTNGNGMLDLGEDANGNGVLDLAEDANNDGILDPGFGIRVVAAGPTSIINANNPTDPAVPTGIFDNSVTANGNGIDMIAVGGALFNAVVTDNAVTNNVDPFGFGVRVLSDGSFFNLIQFADNQTNNNAGDGTQFIAQNGGVLAVGDFDLDTDGSLNANTFTGNGNDGLFINANAGIVFLEDILTTNFAANTRDGLRILAEAGGTVTVGDGTDNNLISENVFQSNGGNGATLIADAGTINAIFGLDGAGTTNNFFNNIGNGLEMNTLNGGVINTSVNRNTAVGNQHGIVFNLDSGTITLASLNNNISTANLGDGVQINNGNGGVFTTTTIANNDFSNNGRAGLFFGGNLPAVPSFNIITTITGNNFDRTASGTTGILFETNNVFTVGSNTFAPILVTLNSFVGGSGATEFGIGGTVTDGGVSLQIGTADPALSNTFTANRGAHIGLQFFGASNNLINIDNGTFQGAQGLNGTFLGEGVHYILRDTSILTGQIQRSAFRNNADDGLRIDISGASLTEFAQLNNFIVGSNANPITNTFEGNGDDGIEIFRTGSGQVNNFRILGNLIQDNQNNGIHLTAANADTVDTYLITDNLIRRNGNAANFGTTQDSGIYLEVRFDADLEVDIFRNVIGGSVFDTDPFQGQPVHLASDGNFADGIQTRERVNSSTDIRSVRGTWSLNTIVNNGDDGIDLDAAMQGLVVGSTANPANGNLIRGNAANGILVTGPGDVTIGFNQILQNGTAGTVLTANETAGINFQVRPSSQVVARGNLIADNIGDGIQYGSPNFSGFFYQVTMEDNLILRNEGRGIDILNRGNNYTQAQVTGNTVSNNLLEGVYVVNTSSLTQTQFANSSTDLLRDGTIGRAPVLEMQFSDNTVLANGLGTTASDNPALSGTGLVVRVGTATGGFGPTFDGGFASIGGAIPIGGSPFFQSTGLGGVVMTVDNNRFGGNAGDDILFHSYVSTVDPNTGTAWSTDPGSPSFNTQGYQSDPLSRFDLYFRNNIIDQDINGVFSFDDVGTHYVGYINRDNLLVAFYDNSDAVFKSRDNSHTGADLDGPFNSPIRARNATRLAARIPFFDDPQSIIGIQFLYPGMGDSTWRISNDTLSDPLNVQNGYFIQNGFFGNVDDPSPVNTTDDEHGNGFLNFVGRNGEQPWGWGLIP